MIKDLAEKLKVAKRMGMGDKARGEFKQARNKWHKLEADFYKKPKQK